MDAAITTAVISAIVSLAVTSVTIFVSRSSIKAEREKLERELQRSMTAKLYEVRLRSYPKAMEITEGLRKSRLVEQGEALSKDYFATILNEIDTWHASKVAFIISRNSLYRLYALRRALRQQPGSNGKYSPEQLDRIWEAKGQFRAALRADIQLLFQEEQSEDIQED